MEYLHRVRLYSCSDEQKLYAWSVFRSSAMKISLAIKSSELLFQFRILISTVIHHVFPGFKLCTTTRSPFQICEYNQLCFGTRKWKNTAFKTAVWFKVADTCNLNNFASSKEPNLAAPIHDPQNRTSLGLYSLAFVIIPKLSLLSLQL